MIDRVKCQDDLVAARMALFEADLALLDLNYTQAREQVELAQVAIGKVLRELLAATPDAGARAP